MSADLSPASERSIDYIMEAVQCFASEWSLVGGRFDSGGMLGQAEATKQRIRRMLEDDARKIEDAGRAAPTERAALAECETCGDTGTAFGKKCACRP